MNDNQDQLSGPEVNTNYFNPYEDRGLTTEKREEPILNSREPFNDVIRHGDIIAGHQRNRTRSDYPKRLRPWVTLWAIIMLIFIMVSIVMSFI